MDRRRPMPKKTLAVVVVVVIACLASFLFVDDPLTQFRSIAGENPLITGAAFAALMFISTVIAPITVFPVIPVTAVAIGAFTTAIISILSWTLGALVAFIVARYLGRPVMRRFVSLEEIDKYERYVPQRAQFLWIIVLRMVLPVDVLSYALGLFSRIAMWKYTLATLIGVAPFSFVLAYIGPAILDAQFFTVAALLVLLLFAFSIGYFVWRRGTSGSKRK